MTKSELLSAVKMEIEGKRGLYWLGRRTKSYTEKLNIVFISTDLELLKNPVEALIDAYGLSSYFSMLENSDVVLVGISREKMSDVKLASSIETLPNDILAISDPDKMVRYTSVTMWGTNIGDCVYISNNTNIVKDYKEFLADRYESGTLKKADMLNLVVSHKTFEKYVLADENFVAGVKKNKFSYWNMKKIRDYLNQQMVALFTDLTAE